MAARPAVTARSAPPPRPRQFADAPSGEAAGDDQGVALVARLEQLVSRCLGRRPGRLAAAPLLQAARAVAFEMDLPLEELPARAAVSEPVRLALVAHLDTPPRPLLEPAASFAAIVEHVCSRLHETHELQRIVVLGCGGGEDIYGVMLALIEKGVDADWFEIDAVDISECALRRARTGWYRESQLRALPSAARTRHFSPREGGLQVLGSLRNRIRFEVADPRSSQVFAGEAAHDVVVCRDHLAAADAGSRRDWIAQLGRRLAPGGLLVLGDADEDPSTQAGLSRFGGSAARAWRRRGGPGEAAALRAEVQASTQQVDRSGQQVRQLVVQGLLRLRKGDHAGADGLFHKAIAQDPLCRGAIEALAREATRSPH